MGPDKAWKGLGFGRVRGGRGGGGGGSSSSNLVFAYWLIRKK